MQKTAKHFELGSYELQLFPEETRDAYRKMPRYEGEDVAKRFFCHLMPRAREESLSFLRELGIMPEKLFFARPLTEPDERGEVLFLCTARLCGTLLRGGDTEPRQSEEAAGISMVFLSDRAAFHQGPSSVGEEEVEMRFVIPLPFDASFFEQV